MGHELELEASYRLRTVRIGVWATLLAVGGLMVFPHLPGGTHLRNVPYMAVLVIALMGVGVIAALPWRRLVERGWALAFMYTWSVLDILLITSLVAIAGANHGAMFLVYALTTVFFGAAGYTTRAQAVLLLLTFVSYTGVVVFFEMGVPIGMVAIRLVLLAGVAYLSSFLAGELSQRMRAELEARRESDRRAGLLATVARAARSISSLQTEAVLEAVVDSALALGFEGASLSIFDEKRLTYRVAHARGLPEEFTRGRNEATQGVPGLVLDRSATVVIDDYSEHPRAVPVLAKAGFRVAVGVPVWSADVLDAVLVAGSKTEREITPQDVEALDLLAAQAGRALENARRFESEKETAERLAELDKLKSDFLASVSHELRTPLTAIEGLGETLTMHWGRMDDDRRLDILRRIVANAQSLGDIVNTLLDFARLEEGHLKVAIRRVSVGEIAAQVAERLSGLLADHLLSLNLDKDLDVEADPMLIERVIENLLANAAKHTPAGTRVRIRAYRDGIQAVVHVSDEGPGIPEEEIRHLGERFFRGGDTDTRGTRGLGLGLALTKEILTLHGSALDVVSEPGKGSRFSFRLPMAPARPLRHLKLASSDEASA